MLLANDFGNEPHYKDIIDPINRYRMIRTLYTHPKKKMVMPDLKRRIPEFYYVYDDFLRLQNGLKIKVKK